MAVMILQHKKFIAVPFLDTISSNPVKTILVNAVGFGGNAVSIIITK
jgi:3-oxoacyl-(acyl-carrier-protein) synthase